MSPIPDNVLPRGDREDEAREPSLRELVDRLNRWRSRGGLSICQTAAGKLARSLEACIPYLMEGCRAGDARAFRIVERIRELLDG